MLCVCMCVSVLLCVSLRGLFVQASLYAVVHFCTHLGPPIPTPEKSVFVTPGAPGKDSREHSLTLCSPHPLKSPCHHHHHHETRWPHLGLRHLSTRAMTLVSEKGKRACCWLEAQGFETQRILACGAHVGPERPRPSLLASHPLLPADTLQG